MQQKGVQIVKVIAVLLLVLLASTAYCADIVTVPTANQLKARQFDIADYYLGLDNPDPQPQSLHAQTLYLGITDQLEVDIHRYDPQADRDKTSIVLNASYLVHQETATTPNVVIGVRNLAEEKTTLAPVDSKKRSWYISAAKNITPMTASGPQLPLIRLHASLGTVDNTLLGEKRHEGLFGGVQALLRPDIGAVAVYDGQDLITGLTYTPGSKDLTLKGGTFGKHWWIGASYVKKML